MRKKYLTLAMGRIKDGKYSWLGKQFFRYVFVLLSTLIKRPLTGPLVGHLIVTHRCNFKCIMCDFWNKRSGNPERELPTQEMKKIIDDFAMMGICALGFGGGEPLIRKDICELICHAKKKNMYTHLVSNGSLVDRQMAQDLLNSGLDTITFSLDGSTSQMHDSIRGYQGAFMKVLDAIRSINSLRKKQFNSFKLNLAVTICKKNLDQILDIVKIGSDLGVDHIGFLAADNLGIQHQNLARSKEIIIDNEADLAKANSIIDQLIRLRKKTDLIDNSAAYLRLLKLFFKARPSPLNCLIGYHSCFVDCYGDIFPCFPWVQKGQTAGNIQTIPLKSYWRSRVAQEIRTKTGACHDCYRDCSSELNLSLQNTRRLFFPFLISKFKTVSKEDK